MKSANITIYGAGYVGLVTGVCLAKSGHHVRVLDIDRAKLESLVQGKTPFFEPDLDVLLTSEIDAGRLTFAHPDDAAEGSPGAGGGRFVSVAVGTPSPPAGSANLRFVR